MLRIAVFSSLAIILTACGGSDGGDAKEQAACGGDGIVASEAWMRAARAGQPTSAAYMTLCNGGSENDHLVAARFAGANAAELHMTTMSAENVASMSPTAGIDLAVGKSVALEPGGAHIMLIGLQEALEAGDEPTLILEFETAPPATIILEVRDETASGHEGH